MSLLVKNLTVDVVNNNRNVSSKYIRLLDNVSFEVNRGEFTAIIGESGCGKSTLFKHLFGFCESTDRVSGSIMLNSVERDISTWTDKVLLIEQSYYDVIDESMSVKNFLLETAIYLNIPEDEIDGKIDEIIKILNMKKFINTSLASLSGGEKKRAYTGIALMRNYDVLLIDEPTTGLDSNCAYEIIDHLKGFKKDDKIIICTIHQPDDKLLERFDSIILMDSGLIFNKGSLEDTIEFVKSAGFEQSNTVSISYFLSKSITEKDERRNNLLRNIKRDDSPVLKSTGVFIKSNISFNKIAYIFMGRLGEIKFQFIALFWIIINILIYVLSNIFQNKFHPLISYDQAIFFRTTGRYFLFNQNSLMAFACLLLIAPSFKHKYFKFYIKNSLYSMYELLIGRFAADFLLINLTILICTFCNGLFTPLSSYNLKIGIYMYLFNLLIAIPCFFAYYFVLDYVYYYFGSFKLIGFIIIVILGPLNDLLTHLQDFILPMFKNFIIDEKYVKMAIAYINFLSPLGFFTKIYNFLFAKKFIFFNLLSRNLIFDIYSQKIPEISYLDYANIILSIATLGVIYYFTVRNAYGLYYVY